MDFPCVNAPPAANVAVIKVVHATPSTVPIDLVAGQEYYDFTVNINHTKTLSTPCTGCTVPVCIVLNSINVVDLGDLHPRFLGSATAPGSNYITWQGGGNPDVGGTIGCPAATPTKRATWGSVKSLYR